MVLRRPHFYACVVVKTSDALAQDQLVRQLETLLKQKRKKQWKPMRLRLKPDVDKGYFDAV